MFEAKSIADSLGGTGFTMIGSDGGFNAPVAAGLVRQGFQGNAPGIADSLTNRFASSNYNVAVGQGGLLQERPAPGIAPATPVVSTQVLQPLQRQFS